MTRTTFHRPPSMTAIARDHSEVQPNETNPGETVSLGLALPLLFAARGPFGRIRSSGLPIEGCQSRGLPSRVVNRKYVQSSEFIRAYNNSKPTKLAADEYKPCLASSVPARKRLVQPSARQRWRRPKAGAHPNLSLTLAMLHLVHLWYAY